MRANPCVATTQWVVWGTLDLSLVSVYVYVYVGLFL